MGKHFAAVEFFSNCKDNGGKARAKETTLKWSSRAEFVISLLGYSLGLSDIWRVPYLTYRNGGGAFLLPYILALLVCGIPLYFLEIMTSQFSGKGSWAVWDFCPIFRGFGISFMVVNWIVSIYATVQKAWIMEYLIGSFYTVLPWSTCNNEWNTPTCTAFGQTNKSVNINWAVSNNSSYIHWNESETIWNQRLTLNNATDFKGLESSVEQFWNYKVLQISGGIDDIGTLNWKYVLYMAGVYVIVWLSLVKSVQSIGKMMYVTCIAPVVLTIIIWIRSLMLPGSAEGMLYFISPDFERISHIEVWIEAGFMAFYTLGPAWGGLAVYGSHNNFRDNCYRDSVITVVVTIAFGLLNGLVVFSVIGVMAAETGMDISKVITSGGFSLGFVAYPKAITYFPLPQLWSVLFIIILLLPGLDAQTVMLEPVLCVLEEWFPRHLGNRRIPLLTVMVILSFLLALPFATQAGVYIFQLIDWYTATFSVLLIALIESILFSWAYGGDRLSRDAKIMLGRKLPPFVRVSCAYLTPVVLIVLVMSSIFKYKPPTYGAYIYPAYASSIGWCFSMMSVVPFVMWMVYAVWKEQGPILQRIKRLLKPLSSWGPCDPDYKAMYRQSEVCTRRTPKTVAWFNLLGTNEMLLAIDGDELNEIGKNIHINSDT